MKLIAKGVYILEGKKVNLERQAKLFLGAEDGEGFVKTLSWKEFKALNVPFTLGKYTKELFVFSLVKQIKKFSTKMDYMDYIREHDRSIMDRIEWLLTHGAQYSKRGLKVN